LKTQLYDIKWAY